MQILIVYASRHGCTRKLAQRVAQELGKGTRLIPVRDVTPADLQSCGTIIIGCSVHAGRIQARIRKFVTRYQSALLVKRIGIFLCHMDEPEEARKHLQNNLPPELLEHAQAVGLFGGEFDLAKMNFLEKWIVKKVAHVEESVTKLHENRITDFIEAMRGEA